MRLRLFGYALATAALLAAPACSGPNNAVDETRPDAANDRANSVTNGTDNPEGAGAGVDATRDDRTTGTAGSMGRAADRLADADPAITMKIQAQYANDAVVKSTDINVDTNDGVVTLKGQVDTRRERDAAEQIARSTEGVKRVVNQLTVSTASR